ncbi:MAG: aminodeoxychorismate synthase component I [candidate division KSB1 bacterium]
MISILSFVPDGYIARKMSTRISKSAAPLLDEAGAFHANLLRWLEQQDGALLLETTRVTNEETQSLLFTQPCKVAQCHELAAVSITLQEIEHALRAGYYVAGFLTYEAGYAFEKTLPTPRLPDAPLVWFGIYETPIIYDHRERRFVCGEEKARGLHEQLRHAAEEAAEANPQPSLTKEEYTRAIAAIKNHIARGDTYQVNFTFKLKFPLQHSAAAWYQRLRRAQRVSYAALLSLPEQHILSFSPELFFRLEERRLTLRPMKGTAARGRTLAEDEEQRRALSRSEKERAENVMIVDLLRNDAGRIAEIGSVQVPRLFELERYETVLQATSTITAQLRPEITIPELLRSLFPCGSITGAPKIRTMQIIHALEHEPRGVYTGAIGYFAPQRKAVFNVAIRTVVLDHKKGVAEMGIGSGVVWDSKPEAEYRECLLKARFLTEAQEELQLLETLRWERSRGIPLLREHLQRLQNSAAYFDFEYKEDTVLAALQLAAQRGEAEHSSANVLRLRLKLHRNGKCEAAASPLEDLPDVLTIGFAQASTHSHDRFLFHKTTKRELYERELETAQTRGWFDAIFMNERGEVTEGCRSNVIIKLRGEYFTPPIACGVLPGVYRAHLLAAQTLPVQEKIFFREELETAEEVWVCNALRGLLRARLEE